MFTFKLSLRRKRPPRDASARADRRFGAPVRRGPEPMPRMRWYSD